MRAKNNALIHVLTFTVAIMQLSSGSSFEVSRSPSLFHFNRETQSFRSIKPMITNLRASGAAPGGIVEKSGDEIYTKIDYSALFYKYPVSLIGQASLIYAFLFGIDTILGTISSSFRVPFAINFLFMYTFNLKSSVFSLLPQRRTDQDANRDFNKANKPSWTPPGLAFVFGWPLLTFGLRAYTASMVIRSMGGKYATLPILSLMFHLGVGNLWNTINTIEKRLGVSVIVLYGLWLTKAVTAWAFYQINPLAGKLLALSLTWITAACALETRTWQINPDSDTGKKEPLLPMQHPKWTTKFRWEV